MRNYYLMTFVSIQMILVLQSCTNNQNPTEQQTPPVTLPVTIMQQKTVTGFQEYPTNIEGIVNSDVRAKSIGYIEKVFVDEGQKVRKGQVLFRLETQTLNQDAGAAKARVNLAQVEVNKLIPLVEKNIISGVQLESARANLAQAQANYSSISAAINYATIKSPIDGFIGTINFREGSLVSPSDQNPLTTVSDISNVYAFFNLNETQYLDFLQNSEGKTLEDKLAKFSEVDLILANGSTYSEKGKIETSSGQINQNTGTVSFRAIFKNPNRLLTNGNSGKIQIPVEYKNAFIVPQESTFDQQGNVMLFKVGKNNKVSTSIVKVKASVNNLYVIESGIKKDEKFVVSGVIKLKNDMVIDPQMIPFEDAMQRIETLFKN